jgi:hypothetical protein
MTTLGQRERSGTILKETPPINDSFSSLTARSVFKSVAGPLVEGSRLPITIGCPVCHNEFPDRRQTGRLNHASVSRRCVRKATHLYEMTHFPDTRKVLPCKLLPFCTLTFLLGSIP